MLKNEEFVFKPLGSINKIQDLERPIKMSSIAQLATDDTDVGRSALYSGMRLILSHTVSYANPSILLGRL